MNEAERLASLDRQRADRTWNPNAARDAFWWTMYINSRDAREHVGWHHDWAAAMHATKSVHAYHAMIAIERQPTLPLPSCSICLRDDCNHDHPCE